MDVTTAIAAGVAILIGATLQRLSGTGVGLVVAPVLAVLIGPVAGILVTNATTVVSGVLILLSMRRDIEWRRYVGFLPGIIVGAVAASFVVRAAPVAWLQIRARDGDDDDPRGLGLRHRILTGESVALRPVSPSLAPAARRVSVV